MRIITGKARGLQLTVPKNYDVRPTADRVKESVFNIIGSKIINATVLDLFAGTGNLGLESWSRGAKSITFIDESKESLRLVKSNIAKCRAENDCTVLKGSAPQVAERMAQQGQRFDFAFSLRFADSEKMYIIRMYPVRTFITEKRIKIFIKHGRHFPWRSGEHGRNFTVFFNNTARSGTVLVIKHG